MIRAQTFLLNRQDLQLLNKHNSKPLISSKHRVVQSTQLVVQSPFMNHSYLQNPTIHAEQLLTSKTDRSVVELFKQQQALQTDTNAIISIFFNYTLNAK